MLAQQVEALSNVTVTAVACGAYHSLAVTSSGRLHEWGLVHTEPDSKDEVYSGKNKAYLGVGGGGNSVPGIDKRVGWARGRRLQNARSLRIQSTQRARLCVSLVAYSRLHLLRDLMRVVCGPFDPIKRNRCVNAKQRARTHSLSTNRRKCFFFSGGGVCVAEATQRKTRI